MVSLTANSYLVLLPGHCSTPILIRSALDSQDYANSYNYKRLKMAPIKAIFKFNKLLYTLLKRNEYVALYGIGSTPEKEA
jgi:hypothetical protein